MNNLNKKKYKLWSDTLNEESLCETIGTFDFSEEKPNKERGVESYKFENKTLTDQVLKNKKQKTSKKLITKVENTSNFKDRIGPKVTFDENKPRPHIRVSELDSDEAVIKEIAKVLKEPRDDVIQRCVKVLGKKKCLELLYATEDLEEMGGMPTSDGYRRRTPGGVFFQLLKKDETILNCQRSQIFIEDIARKKRQKAIKRLKQRERFNKAKKELDSKINKEKSETNEKDDVVFEEQEEEMMIYFDE